MRWEKGNLKSGAGLGQNRSNAGLEAAGRVFVDDIFVRGLVGGGRVDCDLGGDDVLVSGQDGGKGSLAGIFDAALDGAVTGGAGDRLAVALFGRFVVGQCFGNS